MKLESKLKNHFLYQKDNIIKKIYVIINSYFSALRDYSMLYESTIHVTLYYNTTTQSGVKTRYDDYVGQRLSVLRKSPLQNG